MKRIIEVDQSIKIEQSGQTVLAYANGSSHAIVLPGKVKTEGISYLYKKGKSKEAALLLVFAAGLFLLLKDVLRTVDLIYIDIEYLGKNQDVKSFLYEYIKREMPTFDPDKIRFKFVGKESPADKKARNVRAGKDKRFKTVTLRELMRVIV